MADTPAVNTVEQGEEYYHVRFRDPNRFEEIRTPDWAAEVARSVSADSEVRTGTEENSDEWTVEAVLVKKEAGEDKAREQAREIVEKIESS